MTVLTLAAFHEVYLKQNGLGQHLISEPKSFCNDVFFSPHWPYDTSILSSQQGMWNNQKSGSCDGGPDRSNLSERSGLTECVFVTSWPLLGAPPLQEDALDSKSSLISNNMSCSLIAVSLQTTIRGPKRRWQVQLGVSAQWRRIRCEAPWGDDWVEGMWLLVQG